MGVETIKYERREIPEFQEQYIQKAKEDQINEALFGSGVYDRDENGAIIVPCMLTFKNSTENKERKNMKASKLDKLYVGMFFDYETGKREDLIKRRKSGPSDVYGNMENLSRISYFEENWDGYGAEPIPKGVISRVKESLWALNKDSYIFPTARKSIQMEFENSCKDYLEFEFFEDKIVAYREVGTHEEEFEIDIKNIPKYVDEFFELVDIKNRIKVVRSKRTLIRKLRK